MGKYAYRIVKPHQVRITREGEYAVFTYLDMDGGGKHIQIGPQIQKMSDEELLTLHNEMVRNMQAHRHAQGPYVATEIVSGKQLKYSRKSRHWAPRGDVLRCIIGDDENGNPVFEIDGKELRPSEFVRMLGVYAGWGMRIVFVPDDELHKIPKIRCMPARKIRR